MQQIKILVVEDEWIVSEEIKEILEKNGFEVIGQASDAASALELSIQNPPDIALLDINIKGEKDGIELAKILKKNQNIAIIFITAYDDKKFIDRAKELNPHAYIVKPFQEKNIVIAIELAFHSISKTKEALDVQQDNYYILHDRVFIKDNHRFYKLPITHIKYIQAEGSYCIIYTNEGKHTLAFNLKSFESRINHPSIVRSHRSFLVNIDQIDALEGNTIFIGQTPIPISESYRSDIIQRLKLI